MRRFKDATAQEYDCSRIRRFKGTTVQGYDGSRIRRFKDTSRPPCGPPRDLPISRDLRRGERARRL
jgi:hypothetical protein